MSTLKDVAALAQCSLTTASIVANGRGDEMHISPATQQRVAEAIQQLQYRPDRGAQLLRAGRRRLTIALYWPLDHRTTLLGDRLYNFYSILQQEQEPADPYELLIQTYFSGRLGEMLSPILQGRYDGVIIGGAGEQDLIQLENADISTPLVLINAESRKYSTAGVNHAQTGSQAAALIHQKGYRECAVIRGGDHYDGTSQRTKAFLNSCRQLGIRIQPESAASRPRPPLRAGPPPPRNTAFSASAPVSSTTRMTAWPKVACIPWLAAASVSHRIPRCSALGCANRK